ncbi:MAG: site-2 protease family protein [Planctomycetes bacterium]|nr:site-2 protease family protein [Planctomycetota bacterium]
MSAYMDSVGSIVAVILAFSALVFVHELGHFLAALAVGVRVERFFVGFDAWGIKFSRKIRGIECGIGILPLGGYVKLAGQADDPREEKVTGAPDEFRSAPLWGQALILVAGVTMNLIFGFLILVGAYLYGIPFADNVLGQIEPHSPAAVAGLKAGDRVVAINDEEMRHFENIKNYIVGHPNEDLIFVVDRPNENDESSERIKIKVRGIANPFVRGNITTIGAEVPVSRVIGSLPSKERMPEYADKFQLRDEVLSVGGKPLREDMGHVVDDMVAGLANKTVPVKILRNGEAKTVEVKIPAIGKYPLGLYDTGLRYFMEINAISKDGSAAKSGLAEGDYIKGAIDPKTGETIYFRDRHEFDAIIKGSIRNKIDLEVMRAGKDIVISGIKPQFMGGRGKVNDQDTDTLLGITAEASEDGKFFKVTKVFEGGPSEGHLQPGDIIRKAALTGSEMKDLVADSKLKLGKQIDSICNRAVKLVVLKGGKGEPVNIETKAATSFKTGMALIGIQYGNSMKVSTVVKATPDGHETFAATNKIPENAIIVGGGMSEDMKLTTIEWKTDKAEKDPQAIKAETPAYVIADTAGAGIVGYFPPRFFTARTIFRANGVGEAVTIAFNEATRMSGSIYNFIYRIFTGQLSIKAAGGPVIVFTVIKLGVDTGFGYFLWLVAFISINLAVFNLLPFPVLDGGHIVFVIIEWLKGSPPSVRIREIAQYVGLFCLLSLMLTVTAYDIYYSFLG